MTREEAENGSDDMQIDGAVIPAARPETNSVEVFNLNYLKVYYGKLFPYADVYKWMCYGHDGKHPGCDQSYFSRREFAFTIADNVICRFQSFNSLSELQTYVKQNCPLKIDFGAVYNVPPTLKNSYPQFTALEKELVFDIDISDYDDVRYCCSGADVCLKCWPLMTAAIKVMDSALRDDFGFNHILWVFSGRRGVHCWVCDGRARRLTNEHRSSIADYFRVYKGNENNKKVSLGGQALHPFLVKAYSEVLKDFFEDNVIHNQELFSTEDKFKNILNLVPDEAIQSELRRKWQDNKRSSSVKEDINSARWGQFKHLLQSGKNKPQGLRRCVEEIVFIYTYPRLDVEVSRHMGHLLKAPFCVHPKTGKVCVPIDPNCCEDFDPTTVPTLSMLMDELNAGDRNSDADYDLGRTSLGKSINYFRTSFLQPLLKSCKEEIERSHSAKVQQTKDSMGW